MSALPGPQYEYYTVEEFQALVERSETKYEYFDGRVYEWAFMAGTSDPHSRICANVQRQLDNRFEARETPCVSLNSDAYVAIPEERIYRFPDVTVQCGDPEYDTHFSFARTNPTALVEVVSESSREGDYGAKFKQYARLATLGEYVLFEQNYPLCIVHSRADADSPWTTVPYTELEEEVSLPSLDLRIPLGLFYRDLVWTADGVKLVPGAGVPKEAPPKSMGFPFPDTTRAKRN